ncbi:E3 ubiquitin protein ligase SIS3-like protein isoform X3 [Tanacetum coccineum]
MNLLDLRLSRCGLTPSRNVVTPSLDEVCDGTVRCYAFVTPVPGLVRHKSSESGVARGVDFKWYDGFFLSMLATSIIIVAINWKRYHLCTHPLHIWIVVLVDMVRVPNWAFETAAGQEMRGMGQDTASYHPGLYLTEPQREAVEALIQELPKFMLKAVPTDCSECPICLEEFHLGNEVRGLPCAHNFHVACIDEWLRLNVKCPRCRLDCGLFKGKGVFEWERYR